MTTTSPLTDARKAAGMTLDDALVVVRTELPRPLWVSRPTIARLEKKAPKDFDGGDLFVLGVLADAYGCSVRSIYPGAADQLKGLTDLVFRASRWNAETAAPVAA